MVNQRFLGFLGCTGVAAIFALLFPGAVLVGLFLGVLPGLFLGFAPSLFIYLLAWWGLYWLALKIGSFAGFDPTTRMVRRTASLAAIAIIAAVAIVTPKAINEPLRQQIAELQAIDVEPSGDVKLLAVVAVELPKFSGGGNIKPPYCEAICLRLLYNGAVSRVIAAELSPNGKIGPASSYRIARSEQCPKPELLNSLIVWPREWHAERGSKPIGIQARVRARIDAGECLVREAGRLEDAEAVISFREIKPGVSRFHGPWTLRLDTVSARRLEIIDAGGGVLYRRTEVTAEPLVVPLTISTEAGFLTTVTYGGWARTRTEASLLGPHGRDVLPALLGEAARPPDLPDPTRAR